MSGYSVNFSLQNHHACLNGSINKTDDNYNQMDSYIELDDVSNRNSGLMLSNIVKRNARERNSVKQVNTAFIQLRQALPIDNRKKRLSKVRTLRLAIDYIKLLMHSLDDENYENRSV